MRYLLIRLLPYQEDCCSNFSVPSPKFFIFFGYHSNPKRAKEEDIYIKSHNPSEGKLIYYILNIYAPNLKDPY